MKTSIPIKKHEINDHLNGHFHYFICSSSFEERCTVVSKSIAKDKIERVLICQYQNNYERANINTNILVSLFQEKHHLITFEKDNPVQNLDNIIREIQVANSLSGPANILVDISTFTHEMLLILTYLFSVHFTRPRFQVTFIYNSASDYASSEPIQSKWLSKGVGEIRSVLGFSGEIMPFKKTLLIIFVGFEDERVKAIIDLFEPSKVLLGHASEEGAISKDLLLTNKNTFDEILKNIFKMDIDRFEFTCKAPQDIENLLSSMAIQYRDEYNIIVAALNNKISTIGCALAGIKHPELQICYPTALSYNVQNYSESSDDLFLIEL